MVTVTLARDKETKGTYRYAEAGDSNLVGTLYLPKSTVAQLGNPTEITLSVEAAQATLRVAV